MTILAARHYMLDRVRRQHNPTWAGGVVVDIPDGYGWTPPFAVGEVAGVYVPVLWNIHNSAPVGKAYYVTMTGDDGNDGLTWGTALRSVWVALAKADRDVVWVGAGFYDYDHGWRGQSITRSVAVYGQGDVILSTALPGLSWVLDDDLTNTYVVYGKGVSRVIDASQVDANGDYIALTHQASAADVDANPGSWYVDGSYLLWVRTSDDRFPDSDIWCTKGHNGLIGGDCHVYCENIKFFGGNDGCAAFYCLNDVDERTIETYFKDCIFAYSAGNGLGLQGVTLSICQNCLSYANVQDAYNYHASASLGILARGIEISCEGRACGVDDVSANDNGSSAHSGGTMLRMNGLYHHTWGPIIIDIGDGTRSWNLGCTARDSLAAGKPNFDVSGAGSLMWLDHCTSSGSTYDLEAGTGATIYTRVLTSDGNDTGDGVITPY